MKKNKEITHHVEPFLRWAGSKRQLIPILSKFWSNKYDRYVEPFVGSACLFFYLAPEKALLSDINEELIVTYKQVADDVQSVLKELQKIKKNKDNYYHFRSLKPEKLKLNKRAARFIYLNRYCFNGLYRTNSKGEFNVPYCGDSRGMMPSEQVFTSASYLLKKAELYANSYQTTLKKVKSGDFVYMDPPFSVRSKEIFNQYDKSKFGMSDIMQLRKWMEKLDSKRIQFVVSYAESDEANLLKEGFSFQTVSVRRSIAGFIHKRKVVNEVIIFNKT
jgi:DNA adenine methylase